MLDIVWLIPALPLAGFAILFFFGRRIGDPWSGWLASAMLAGSTVASLVVFAGLVDRPGDDRQFIQTLFSWVPVGGLQVDVGFLVDPLSVTMILFVTFVATLIHVYSIGYMKGDERFSTYFAYLNLFVFFMLVLVLGDSLLLTFLGWEGVGACSYLLISFWFTTEANAVAGKKAFVTNRVGDLGFMLAMFVAFAAVGSLNYAELLPAAPVMATATATAIVLLLFVGVAGKSAQIPLYVWLPDAMAGPTPVSALIHAATMVTAGLYLLVRATPLLAVADPWSTELITWVGIGTAFLAATIAIAQNDIKKVLAYSTISQLGYMVFIVGVGANVAAIFHMVSHAFFKALLFLAAGAVIHGLHHEQDLRHMGALRKVMPWTAGVFIVGWLAIIGVPPFSGFFSKDEILANAWQEDPVLWAVGVATALLTAYYMSRLTFMAFFGEARWAGEAHPTEVDPAAGEAHHEGGDHDGEEHEGEQVTGAEGDAHGVEPHESPPIMVVPMVVLAFFAVFAGAMNLPFSDDTKLLEHWLEPVVEAREVHLTLSGATQVALALFALVLVGVGLLAARWVYLQHPDRAERYEPKVLANGWYIDRSIAAFVGGPGLRLFEGVAWFDTHVVDGAVNGVATLVRSTGQGTRRVQSGYVRTYALAIGLGAVVVVAWLLLRAGW